MLKKLIPILLVFCTLTYINALADTDNFHFIREYDDYLDVSDSDWFYSHAAVLYRLGLAEGYDGKFMPYNQLSVAEAITFAARLHSIFYTGSTYEADNFAPGENWYDTYIDYAVYNSVTDDRFYGLENEPVSRKYAAYIFSFVFPTEDINLIDESDIPDAEGEYSYYICKAYKSGIMNGLDSSLKFSPDSPLLRCEAAAIVSRCAVPDMRISGIEKSSFAANMPEASYADGIIVVSSPGGGTGNLSFHKKSGNGVWHEIISVPCYIGKNGLGKTQEGDGKTPCGTFKLGFAFGNEADPGTVLEYINIDDSMYWVDDSASAYYNTLVSTQNVTPDWSSAEHPASYPTAYAYAINVEYNHDRIPGLGSAIFIHCSTGNSTAGCIAIDQNSMIRLLNSVTENTVIIIG